MTEILDGAQPFLLPGGKRGVLLIHGFTGSPAEMVLLGRHLRAIGYTVLAPRLCGHGTTPEELAATSRENWYHSACDGYHLLKGLCDEINVVGLSMGGLLAIRLGIAFDVRKVVSLSAPIQIADPNLRYLPPKEKSGGLYVRRERRKFRGLPDTLSVSYKKTPLLSIHHLLDLIEDTINSLPALEKPLLVVQSKNDHTVLAESAEFIYRKCESREKELFWLARSGHLVTLDEERETVFNKVAEFLC